MLPKNEPIRRARSGHIRKRALGKPTSARVFLYSSSTVEEFELTDRAKLEEVRRSELFKWIDVEGVGTEDRIRLVGEVFDLHPLALEDVLKGGQRPKAELYLSNIFLVTQLGVMVRPGDVEETQVSIFLGSDFVITFVDRWGEVFDPLREGLRRGGSRLRTSGVDYLAYRIVDVIIDHYFPVLEDLGEYFQDIEDEVTGNPSTAIVRELQQLRRELICVRRAIWPQRDALNTLLRGEDPFFTANVRVYLRDCYDHTVQIIDVTETYRELAAGLFDLYHSALSMRLNEVMKVLAIISTVFMPLSFLAGVYGMNFEYMPELKEPYGYLYWWITALLVTLGMVVFFRKRGWISAGTPPRRHRKRR